jgi:hypothetical protein
MTQCNDSSKDWSSLLKGGTSQLVSEHYEDNTSHTVLFLKTYGEDTCRCPYNEYSSLNRWQTNMDLLFDFSLCNLHFITVQLRQGKNVIILTPGDVNHRPIPSR